MNNQTETKTTMTSRERMEEACKVLKAKGVTVEEFKTDMKKMAALAVAGGNSTVDESVESIKYAVHVFETCDKVFEVTEE